MSTINETARNFNTGPAKTIQSIVYKYMVIPCSNLDCMHAEMEQLKKEYRLTKFCSKLTSKIAIRQVRTSYKMPVYTDPKHRMYFCTREMTKYTEFMYWPLFKNSGIKINYLSFESCIINSAAYDSKC